VLDLHAAPRTSAHHAQVELGAGVERAEVGLVRLGAEWSEALADREALERSANLRVPEQVDLAEAVEPRVERARVP
jgi:hypothetical protein